MRTAGKPIIARVNGHALAGGFGLAAACDIVVAVEHAKMGTTEIRVGLWPMQISAILQRLMPARRALELFMTGRVFPATEAVELGVVTRTVDDLAALDAAVDATRTDQHHFERGRSRRGHGLHREATAGVDRPVGGGWVDPQACNRTTLSTTVSTVTLGQT